MAIDAYGNEDDYRFGWESDTTNNRMEMQAWIEGLNYVYDTYGPCDVLVYSDSEYVGLGATDRTRKRNNNVDLWVAIDEAIRLHNSFEFVHVRGHADSHYNCEVDRYAGEARQAGLAQAVIDG